jgi:hypothetical protein
MVSGFNLAFSTLRQYGFQENQEQKRFIPKVKQPWAAAF